MSEEKFYMEQVFAGDITVDHNLQRELQPDQVKMIRNNLDPAAVGVIYLSKREDGLFYAMDGQNRVYAIREMDPTFIFNALVYEGLTPEREAQLFIRFNEDRKNIHPIDKFKVHLAYQDEPHTSINLCLHRYGLDVGRASSTNRIAAAQKLVTLTNSFGLDKLDCAIGILSSAWSRSADSWRGEVIGAVTRLLYFNPQIDAEHLRETLSMNEPMNWVRMKRHGTSTSTDADISIAEKIADRYNKVKRGKSRIQATMTAKEVKP